MRCSICNKPAVMWVATKWAGSSNTPARWEFRCKKHPEEEYDD